MEDETRMAELIEQLRANDRVMRELASRHVSTARVPHDLTLRQLQTLFVVRSQPGVTGQELAERFDVSTPTISGMVDRLAGKGLLTREPDPADRRRVLLALTDQALGILGDFEALTAQVQGEVLTRLTAEELETLVRLSARIRQVAEELVCERQQRAD